MYNRLASALSNHFGPDFRTDLPDAEIASGLREMVNPRAEKFDQQVMDFLTEATDPGQDGFAPELALAMLVAMPEWFTRDQRDLVVEFFEGRAE